MTFKIKAVETHPKKGLSIPYFCAIKVHLMEQPPHRQEPYQALLENWDVRYETRQHQQAKWTKPTPRSYSAFPQSPLQLWGSHQETPLVILRFLVQLPWQEPCGQQGEISC